MKTEFRLLGGHAAIYGIGVVLSRVAGLLLLPVYTRYLTPADYGVLELLSMTVQVAGIVTIMGISAALFKFHSDYDEAGDKNEVVSTAWVALGTTGLVTAGVGIVASPWLTQLVFDGQQPVHYFRLFFAIFFFQRLELVPFALLRIQMRSVTFAFCSVAKLALQLSLNVYFVVFAQKGLEGVLIGNLLAGLVVSTGLTVYLLREVGWSFSREKLRKMMRFGWPIAFSGLATFLVLSSDRYFVNAYFSIHEVGIYSLSYRFVGVLTTLVVAPFMQVWEPLRFDIAKGGDRERLLPRVFTYLNVVMLIVATLLVVNAPEVLRLMAHPSFLPAYEPMLLLVTATVVFHWASFSSIGILHRGRTGIFGWLSIYNVAVVLAANWLFIPRWGYMGAAWATLVAYGLRYVPIYVFSQRLMPIRYEWTRVTRAAAVCVVLGLARLAVGMPSLPVAIAWDVLLSLSGPALIWALVLNRAERKSLLELLSGRLPRSMRRSAAGKA